jgi:hypothetical protein
MMQTLWALQRATPDAKAQNTDVAKIDNIPGIDQAQGAIERRTAFLAGKSR